MHYCIGGFKIRRTTHQKTPPPQADNGQFFLDMDAAWNSEVRHARQHYRTWSEVFMAAQSHVNYLRVKGLRQDRWHSRAVQVRNY